MLPLSRHADLSPKARDLAAALRKRWNVDFDDAGAIGRRYRRQDEIGTPFCVTVDFDTLDDNAVTVRERDSMAQERIGLDAVEGWQHACHPADRFDQVPIVSPLVAGGLMLGTPVVLAPMAGITNRAFRRLCRESGAGLYVSEMITSGALVERKREHPRDGLVRAG